MAGCTRREFIKAGLTSAGCFVLGGPFVQVLDAAQVEALAKGVSSVSGKYYKAVPTTCGMCEAGCGILAFIENERAVTVQGNPLHPNNRGKICAKGIAGINYLYDPERIIFPIKRRGARGENAWQRITWDEAYGQIADRLQQQSGKERVLEAGPGAAGGLSRWLYGRMGVSSLIDATNNANRRRAHELTWGAGAGVYDVSASRYVLNFGADPFANEASYISLAQRIVDAKMKNRIKLVTIDVRLSNTAGRSDEWIPVNPGTDGMVALAMARTLLERGLADRTFLSRWTNYPVDALAKHLESYDALQAEAISGIKAEDIERIALEIATNKPATIISGGGIASHGNGVYNERCLLLLRAVAGTIDAPGGYCMPQTYPVAEHLPGTYRGDAAYTVYPQLGSFLRAGKEIGVYLSMGANPVYADPHGEDDVAGALQDESRIPCVVAVDTHLSKTARLADIVLPAATFFESWGLESRPAFERIPFVSLRQPVVDPIGESVPYDEICLQLAKRVSVNRNASLPFEKMRDVVETVVSLMDGLVKEGGLDYLKHRGVWIGGNEKAAYHAYRNKRFNTPSGTFELYAKGLEGSGSEPLPVYKPLEDEASVAADEFVLVRYEVPVHAALLTANAKWAQEIAHDNALWINPEAAKRLTINNGDMVTVSSKAGTVRVRAQLRQGIHPRVVALAAGMGHEAYGHIARAEAFDSDDPDTSLVWWNHAGNGINVNALIPLQVDPIGMGQAWMDTKVSITKA